MTTNEVDRIYWERYRDLNVLDLWNFTLQDDLARDSISFQLESYGDQAEAHKPYEFTTKETFDRFSSLFVAENMNCTPDGTGGIIGSYDRKEGKSNLTVEFKPEGALYLDFLDPNMHLECLIPHAIPQGDKIADLLYALYKGTKDK
jgi:hypothetical protein